MIAFLSLSAGRHKRLAQTTRGHPASPALLEGGATAPRTAHAGPIGSVHLEADFRSVFPAKAGIQSYWERGPEASFPNKPHRPHWTPAFAGDAEETARGAKTGNSPFSQPRLTTKELVLYS